MRQHFQKDRQRLTSYVNSSVKQLVEQCAQELNMSESELISRILNKFLHNTSTLRLEDLR